MKKFVSTVIVAFVVLALSVASTEAQQPLIFRHVDNVGDTGNMIRTYDVRFDAVPHHRDTGPVIDMLEGLMATEGLTVTKVEEKIHLDRKSCEIVFSFLGESTKLTAASLERQTRKENGKTYIVYSAQYNLVASTDLIQRTAKVLATYVENTGQRCGYIAAMQQHPTVEYKFGTNLFDADEGPGGTLK